MISHICIRKNKKVLTGDRSFSIIKKTNGHFLIRESVMDEDIKMGADNGGACELKCVQVLL